MWTLDWDLEKEVGSENITNLWISEWGGWPQKECQGREGKQGGLYVLAYR